MRRARWLVLAIELSGCESPVADLPVVPPVDLPASECSTLSGRIGASATHIPELGQVLILGGYRLEAGTVDYPRLIERFDPATGISEAAAELGSGLSRSDHTATRLNDGRILIAGGEAFVQLRRQSLRSALIIDARDPAKVDVGPVLMMREARSGHKATLLPDGRVLITGGRVLNPEGSGPEDHTYLSSVEVYDPERGEFDEARDRDGNALDLRRGRYGHTSTLVGSLVVVAGGYDGEPVRELDVFSADLRLWLHAIQGVFVLAAPIFHTATAIDDQYLLVAGGASTMDGLGEPSDRVELWTSLGDARACSAHLPGPRSHHTAVEVGGSIVLAGGRSAGEAALGSYVVIRSPRSCADLEERPLCLPRSGPAAVAVGDQLVVTGGLDDDRSVDGIEVIDPD